MTALAEVQDALARGDHEEVLRLTDALLGASPGASTTSEFAPMAVSKTALSCSSTSWPRVIQPMSPPSLAPSPSLLSRASCLNVASSVALALRSVSQASSPSVAVP